MNVASSYSSCVIRIHHGITVGIVASAKSLGYRDSGIPSVTPNIPVDYDNVVFLPVCKAKGWHSL